MRFFHDPSIAVPNQATPSLRHIARWERIGPDLIDMITTRFLVPK